MIPSLCCTLLISRNFAWCVCVGTIGVWCLTVPTWRMRSVFVTANDVTASLSMFSGELVSPSGSRIAGISCGVVGRFPPY